MPSGPFKRRAARRPGARAADARDSPAEGGHRATRVAPARARGVLLWLGERNTTLRLPARIALHDVATFFTVALVLGHLHLSLIAPAARPTLRGITRGTVRPDWARMHHQRWTPGPSRLRSTVSSRSAALAALVALVGVATAAALALDTLQ